MYFLKMFNLCTYFSLLTHTEGKALNEKLITKLASVRSTCHKNLTVFQVTAQKIPSILKSTLLISKKQNKTKQKPFRFFSYIPNTIQIIHFHQLFTYQTKVHSSRYFLGCHGKCLNKKPYYSMNRNK